MRVMECACGERLQAEDDERLFERARDHMDRVHPEKGIEDEHVHNLIEATAAPIERKVRLAQGQRTLRAPSERGRRGDQPF